jgi:hypothetical protein
MAALALRSKVRMGVLLTILAALLAGQVLRALATLLARFNVRVKSGSCSADTWLPILTCEGTATIPGYVLGFIVTAERAVRPDERPGTQVVLFAISRA